MARRTCSSTSLGAAKRLRRHKLDNSTVRCDSPGMAIELGTAFVAGVIGLLGGLSGVFLGHILSSSRESNARRIDGLRQVTVELNKRSRLALHFDQHLNVGLRNSTPSEFALKAFELEGWREATHEWHEQSWKFPCMAFLPEALDEFEEMDQQIGYIMDPYAEKPDDPKQKTREAARQDFFRLQTEIEVMLLDRVAKLVPWN